MGLVRCLERLIRELEGNEGESCGSVRRRGLLGVAAECETQEDKEGC